MRAIMASDVPRNSILHSELKDAYFFDCYEIPISSNAPTAMEFYLRTARQTPRWVNALMAARNRLVSWVGLKNLGRIEGESAKKLAQDYRVGERVGIFTIFHVADEEIVLGDVDKHLRVKLSVCKQQRGEQTLIAVSTVVHLHNALGRFYMFFVGPMHKIIVPAVLARSPDLAHPAKAGW